MMELEPREGMPLAEKLRVILRQSEGQMTLPGLMDRPFIKGAHATEDVRATLGSLCDAGEVLRVDQPGGRSLYQFRARGNGHAKLSVPAAPPAVLAPAPAAAEPAPEPSRAARAAHAPAPEGKVPAPPGARGKPRELIVAAIAAATSPLTQAEIAKATGVSNANVAYHCRCLAKEKLIRDGAGPGNAKVYSIAGSKPVDAFVAKKRAEKAAKPPKFKRSVSSNCLPGEALDHLERVLTRKPVERFDTKRAVLERLAKVLDPTIGAVLEEIISDLRNQVEA